MLYQLTISRMTQKQAIGGAAEKIDRAGGLAE
jgi:hypothetical protein